MSTDATPTDRTTPGATTRADVWRADDGPTPVPDAPLLFSLVCRRRLPNTIDEANAYAGPGATDA